MKVKNILDKAKWNEWVQKNNGSFLQSWQWGAFQYSYGRNVEYLAVEEENKIKAGTLLIKYALPAGRFYYFSPYGPIKYHEEILENIRDKANKEKVIFWRYESEGPSGNQVKALHPQTSLILNMQAKSEGILLNEMKSKTRYNIKLAQKKDVKIRVSTDMKDLDIFYDLISATARRQKINIHPKSYYQAMLHTLEADGMLKIYLAEYEGKALAANMMIFFEPTVTYLHGGTSDSHRELMAPHLLQWQAICDALHQGYKYYDFFGIADSDDPAHPWAGITRFKKGFGGEIITHYGTWEMPLNTLWYNAYRVSKKLRKKT
ncbi:MAG: peptidoglycan bridge formation glycyltransferase FemA/FemB family protein [Patescibacteria group bacterium]